MTTLLTEIGRLQDQYTYLLKTHMTKKDLCDLVVPFRDKYHLTDLQALQIARNEMPISEMAKLLETKRIKSRKEP